MAGSLRPSCADMSGASGLTRVAAVDIGATSGRVLTVQLQGEQLSITETGRFNNGPIQVGDDWCWDVDALYSGMVQGLTQAEGVQSFGIDTWALDYAVLAGEQVIGPVRAYRDPRHARGIPIMRARMSWEEQYAITGIQDMPINTIYQVAADEPQRIADGHLMLMVPDLLAYRATGAVGTDITNASTTSMVDVRTRQWSPAILAALGVPTSAFLPPEEPGMLRGHASDPRLRGLPLVGVATHDTASAFVGAPIADRDHALVLSLGTWALIGAELATTAGQVITPSERARDLNVTHELGVDGTVRLLRNVSGMWLLEECRRSWTQADGVNTSVTTLLEAAELAPAHQAVFDVDDPDLAAPGQDEHTIAQHLIGRWDGSRGAVVRTILESLVTRLAQRAAELDALLGAPRPILHVVGGASRMSVVMQWLADATGKTVVAGPAEATALGNALVQLRTLGAVSDISAGRRCIAQLPEVRTFLPQGDRHQWEQQGERLAAQHNQGVAPT